MRAHRACNAKVGVEISVGPPKIRGNGIKVLRCLAKAKIRVQFLDSRIDARLVITLAQLSCKQQVGVKFSGWAPTPP